MHIYLLLFSSVSTVCDPMDCSTPGFTVSFTVSWSLLKLVSMESVMPSNHLILSPPTSPALSLSQHQGLFQELALHIRWPKCWSFSFSISLSNEYSKLICFRIYWFVLCAVQGTLKSILKHSISKSSMYVRVCAYSSSKPAGFTLICKCVRVCVCV